jgi:RNA polymerase sigma-70 factor (ECF subfamily)
MNKPYNLTREILERHHEQAYKWAMSCCDYDHEKAREVMQTVYVEILNNKAVFRGESSLRTWLFSVVSRVAWRQLRSIKAGEKLKAGVARLFALDHDARDGAQAVANGELVNTVMAAMADLPMKQRQIIELVYYRDCTLAEAAVILGIGLGSARTHFHRAKTVLAGRLESFKEYRN